MVWIYALPAWLFMPLAVAVACGMAAGGLRIARFGLGGTARIAHNDVAGPILSTIGTVLAVMLSFMVVGVWQEFDQAAQTAQTEASAISDLHHLADAFPAAVQRNVKHAVDRYAALVIQNEWPLMRRGETSLAAHDAAYAVAAVLLAYKPGTVPQQNLQSRALDETTIMLDARRNRIFENQQGIPGILWASMLLLGAVTVVFSFYFRVERASAHYVMVVALAGVVAITFSLIAELDYPFRGDIAVSPRAFTEVMHALHPRGISNLNSLKY